MILRGGHAAGNDAVGLCRRLHDAGAQGAWWRHQSLQGGPDLRRLDPGTGVGMTLSAFYTVRTITGRYTFVADAYLGVVRSLDTIIAQHGDGMLRDEELVTVGEDLLRTAAVTVLTT